GNGLGKPDKPIAIDASSLGVTAVVYLSKSVAVHYDAIPCLETRALLTQHHADQINAGDEAKFPDNGHLARYRETVLIVDCRVLDRHGDIAVHEVGLRQLGDDDALPVAVFGCEQRTERGCHVMLPQWASPG